MNTLTPGDASDHVWLDVRITPNNSLTNRVAWTLAGSVVPPGALICAATAWMGAWLVTPLVVLSILALAGMILWHARQLGLYEQRVCLTDASLLVETRRNTISPVERAELSPHWLRVDRVNDTGRACDSLVLRAGLKKLEIGSVLSPPERASLADAIDAALRTRRTRQSLAA